MELGDVHAWVQKVKEVKSEDGLKDVVRSWMEANNGSGYGMPLAIAEAIRDQYEKVKPAGRHRSGTEKSGV